ncbi:unnamed protein product [Amoebophrya sp. A120]|nr:unnamed protein product [Amoebophrya sp. A120]|eukprot:GSA120T00001469001.1
MQRNPNVEDDQLTSSGGYGSPGQHLGFHSPHEGALTPQLQFDYNGVPVVVSEQPPPSIRDDLERHRMELRRKMDHERAQEERLSQEIYAASKTFSGASSSSSSSTYNGAGLGLGGSGVLVGGASATTSTSGRRSKHSSKQHRSASSKTTTASPTGPPPRSVSTTTWQEDQQHQMLELTTQVMRKTRSEGFSKHEGRSIVQADENHLMFGNEIENHLQHSVRELVDEEAEFYRYNQRELEQAERRQFEYNHSQHSYQKGGSTSSSSGQLTTSSSRGAAVNSQTPAPQLWDPSSPAFYEQNGNKKTVFSYHGIQIQDQTEEHRAGKESERSVLLVVVGFLLVSLAIAIVVMWCDLASEETKTLHRYTHWCSAGLIDYLPAYYASYAVMTFTVILALSSRHPTLRRAVQEFMDACKARCLPHRYRALDDDGANGYPPITPFPTVASHRETPFSAHETPLGVFEEKRKKKKKHHREKNNSHSETREKEQLHQIRQKTADIHGLMASKIGRSPLEEPDAAALEEAAAKMTRALSGSSPPGVDVAKNNSATKGTTTSTDGQASQKRSGRRTSRTNDPTQRALKKEHRKMKMQAQQQQQLHQQQQSGTASGFATPGAGPATAGLDLSLQHASPVYSENAWASCMGSSSSSSSSSSESESSESEEDGGGDIQFRNFRGLRPEVREQVFRELNEEQILIIRALIEDLSRGVIQRIHPQMTPDKVASFCRFFGGAECGCMRFLKVTGWDRRKAMERITKATLWRHHEMPRLRQTCRDVLDEFNAVPKEAVFPCVGSYYTDRAYQAYDGSPVEFWRLSKINFTKLFAKYTEDECELAYVNYVLRKEETCRRCRAQGIFAVIDCKNASVSSMVWQVPKLKIMIRFMGKYGEQFFPDSISRALVYNAPKGADYFWKLFSSVLSAATREKVQIVSTDGREEISKLMDLRIVSQLEQLLPE